MRRLKTLRRPPIYPKTPGHLPCSSLTHPLPLSSRRPSVSFGGFGVKHSRTGASVTLKRGILISGPLWYTMGKGEAGNLTFNWEFEEIIPDFAKVNFADVPTVAGP